MTVVWNTDVAAWGGLAIGPLGEPPTVIPGDVATVCAIAVDGLAQGARVCLHAAADGAGLDGESIFDRRPGQGVHFQVVGDSGSGDAAQLAVRDRILVTPADFIMAR